MKEFQITNNSVFAMKGTSNRFFHLATIVNNLREYICMVDISTHACYIEEVTGGTLSFIEDDSLAFDLAKYCDAKGITDMRTVTARVRAGMKE